MTPRATALDDLFPLELLGRMLEQGYVRHQTHPDLPLSILNYTEKAAYEGVWNPVTLQCRGLIYEQTPGARVVARPFPKFFNHGQEGAPTLALDAPAVVTEKVDGSLGILYPTADGHAVATRGSFTSEQAVRATSIFRDRYSRWSEGPREGLTYLFEIIYPENRIVVDYADLEDIVFLCAIETSTGRPSWRTPWPGLRVGEFPYRTLGEAIAAAPRPNCEGLVVYLPDTNERVKIKQDDYVALHRILTGTNARHVWEVAAVHACAHLVGDPKHWGSFLGIDPARADEIRALGDEWLADVPDEFYDWVARVIAEATERAGEMYVRACHLADEAREIPDRARRYQRVRSHVFVKEVMRLASASTPEATEDALAALRMRCWREAAPEPTAPWARTEDVA